MAPSSNLIVRSQTAEASTLPSGAEILDALPQPVAILDTDGVIRGTNSAWKLCEVAEFMLGAPYGAACESIFELGPGGRAFIENGIWNVLNGREQRFSAEFPLRGGKSRTNVTITGISNNGFRGAIVLHSPAPVATAESEEHRRQSEKMEAVGRLVGGVAHDFANLLTLISGYSEMVLNRVAANEPLRAELEEIRKAAIRGSRLTSQILGFTRGEAVEPRILDLNAVIGDMEKMLRTVIGENIQLATGPAPELGKVYADPGHMEQIIMNLVLNARDAMPRGGSIRIETANVDLGPGDAAAHGLPPGRYVGLSFLDNGEGMDQETVGHVFEPFFTTKEKGKGTGLGLSTVYSIVKRYGGDVLVRSTPGAGTTFTILLPRTDGRETAESRVPPQPAARGTETILLVEDEESVRRLLKHILSKQGYTVLEADDGPTALDIMRSHEGQVHLLLTDMVMPRMSGREVAQRCLEIRPGTRVIYMSGYTDDVLMRTGALGPGMSFLQKPLRPEVLSARVREVLDAPVARRA